MMGKDKNKTRVSIAFIHNLRIPSEMAHSIYVVKSCKAAAQIGYMTCLFCPKRTQPAHFPYKNLWRYYNIEKDLFSLKRLKVIELPTTKFMILRKIFKHLRYPLISWSFHLRALRELVSSQPSIISTSDREIVLLLKIFTPIYSPKVIYTVHIEPRNGYEKVLDFLMKSRVDLFVVTVNYLKKYYRSKGIPEKHIIVTPNGVDLEEYRINESISELRKKFNIPTNKKVIGYIGRFETMGMEKGIFELIEALHELKKENLPVAICAVGGPRKYLELYRRRAIQLGLEKEEAIFKNQVKPRLVPYYLKAFDVCALLYPYNHHFANVMSPMKAIEYMASKKPIVVSDHPSTRQIFSDSEAFFTDSDDLKAITQSLKEALYNETHAKKKTKEAYEKVKKLTWKKRQKKILRALAKV